MVLTKIGNVGFIVQTHVQMKNCVWEKKKHGREKGVHLRGHLYIKLKMGEASRLRALNTKVKKNDLDSRHRFRIQSLFINYWRNCSRMQMYYFALYYIEIHIYTHSRYSGLWIFSLNHLEFQCVEEEFRVNISNEHLNIHRNFPTGIF